MTYTQVKKAVRELLRVKKEVFMPLVHWVGEAQVDFAYALAKVSCSRTIITSCCCMPSPFKKKGKNRIPL